MSGLRILRIHNVARAANGMDEVRRAGDRLANRQTPVTNRRHHCPATGTPNHRSFRGSIGRSGSKGSEMISDAAYFTIRADEERSAAMNASQTIARQTHLELANRYQDMADAIIEAGGLLLDNLLAA